jgi:signal transduction histidine kinase
MSSGMAAILSADESLLFDTFTQGEAALLDLMPQAEGRYAIRRFEGRQYQLIKGEADLLGQSYIILFAWELSGVYQVARDQTWSAMGLLLALCAMLAAALYAALRASFRPLERLDQAARRIAQGDYAARADIVHPMDEVGQLAATFNQMAAATQGHIERLTDQDELQKQFIADMAHEMKTPMTTIIGYADLLRRSPLSDEQRAQAQEAIFKQSERLERMSFKLMQLSKLDSGQPLKMDVISAAVLFAHAAQGLERQLEDAGVALIMTESGESWRCEADLMTTLLVNLLSNSIKASHAGGHIWLEASPQGICVRDEGSGISTEHLPHVTEAFYMGDKSRARAKQGAGLGLSICSRIASLHGAQLRIHSAENEGTRVCIEFTAP